MYVFEVFWSSGQKKKTEFGIDFHVNVWTLNPPL